MFHYHLICFIFKNHLKINKRSTDRFFYYSAIVYMRWNKKLFSVVFPPPLTHLFAASFCGHASQVQNSKRPKSSTEIFIYLIRRA